MPVPHGKVDEVVWPRPTAATDGVGIWGPQVPDSVEGVLGCELVGDLVLLANELLRNCGIVWVSFNQEVRRTDLCAGAEVIICSILWASASSSELARASESGVARLALSLSSKMEELLAEMPAYDGCTGFPPEVSLLVCELMLVIVC